MRLNIIDRIYFGFYWFIICYYEWQIAVFTRRGSYDFFSMINSNWLIPNWNKHKKELV